jgi:hypothetical protein
MPMKRADYERLVSGRFWEPSQVLAPYTPWWVLHLIDRLTPLCWTSMVMWKLGYGDSGWNWWPHESCFNLTPPVRDDLDLCDYCGKFDKGARFEPATEATR